MGNKNKEKVEDPTQYPKKIKVGGKEYTAYQPDQLFHGDERRQRKQMGDTDSFIRAPAVHTIPRKG